MSARWKFPDPFRSLASFSFWSNSGAGLLQTTITYQPPLITPTTINQTWYQYLNSWLSIFFMLWFYASRKHHARSTSIELFFAWKKSYGWKPSLNNEIPALQEAWCSTYFENFQRALSNNIPSICIPSLQILVSWCLSQAYDFDFVDCGKCSYNTGAWFWFCAANRMEILLVISAIATLALVLRHSFQMRRAKHHPSEIIFANHWLPWIGSPLRYMAVGPRAFLQECRRVINLSKSYLLPLNCFYFKQ